MKIALICPSNILYMPYVENYISILDKLGVSYDIINWDRFRVEEQSELVYRDFKVGHQRGFLDYLRFSIFIKKRINGYQYDKVIVFGIQLLFFLKGVLTRKYINNYIADIRDYNKIIKYFSIKKVLERSEFTVISSYGYKEWLPKSDKYIMNHNLNVNNAESIEENLFSLKKNSCEISYIGTITNLDINIELINQFANDEEYTLKFIGDGLINNQIENYIKNNSIKNVIVEGRYLRNMEEKLYKSTDFVNMLLYGDNINSRTCLSNRLYKAAYYGKPLIAVKGTLIATVITKYNLGLVVNSLDELKDRLTRYMNDFQEDKFKEGRIQFLEEVVSENYIFFKKIENFLKSLN